MDDIGYFTKDGTWVSENPDNFKIYLSKFAQVRSVLKAKKWYKQRTAAENNYYWSCLVQPLADEFGFTKTEMHDSLKSMFLKIETLGKPPKILSTVDLDTIDAEKYYDEIRIWALTEYDIRLMLPNEYVE